MIRVPAYRPLYQYPPLSSEYSNDFYNKGTDTNIIPFPHEDKTKDKNSGISSIIQNLFSPVNDVFRKYFDRDIEWDDIFIVVLIILLLFEGSHDYLLLFALGFLLISGI